MSITGESGGPPVKAGLPITDLGAGLFALVGILAALEHRHRTGVGQQIDTSLVEAGVALSVWEATEYFAGLGVPQPKGSAHRMFAPYQAIRCADGYITLGTERPAVSAFAISIIPNGRNCRNSPRIRRVCATGELAARIEEVTSLEPRRH
jgi:formyl-CoA transferase